MGNKPLLKTEKKVSDNNNNENDLINKEEINKAKKLDLKYELTIRIYSDTKCTDKFKNYLNIIKMKDWEIKYLDNGFSKENTKKLVEIYKQRSKNKRNYNEVLVIIIDSLESFINSISEKEEEKDFLKVFNEYLYIEEQPFLLFLDKNFEDFIYKSSDEKSLKDLEYKQFEKECIDFISENKEEYNIEINYLIEFNDSKEIIPFLEAKKGNKDNFNIILENKEQFIYSSRIYEEIEQNQFNEKIKNEKNLIIKNLDCNIKLEEDYKYLKELNTQGNIKFQFRYYKSIFNELFENNLNKYKLLDKRNFIIQSCHICPYRNFQKFCGYYHEYGDALIKDKFQEKYPSKINIGICGRAGAGKSTLLNVILGEKRCLEGQGQSVSTFITNYSHPEYPINFVDFPGFGDKENAENLIKKINEKKDQLEEIKEKFHIILYCVRFGERTFLDKEEDVIYELMKLNIKIIFIFTRGEKENSPEFKRFKINFMNDLCNILIKKDIKIDKKDIDIISVYSMKEERNEFLIEPFGIDALFKKIHEILKGKKINNSILEKLKTENNEEKLDELIKSTNFINIYQSKKNLIEAMKKKIMFCINNFLNKIFLKIPIYYLEENNVTSFFLLTISSNVKDLISELSCIYSVILDKNDSDKLSNEITELITKSINKGIFDNFESFLNGLAYLGINIKHLSFIIGTSNLSCLFLKLKKIISKKLENYENIDINNYLYLFAVGINEGIDGIEKISEDFKNIYEKNKSC